MQQERQQEIRGLFQILEQTAEIAEDSILTEAHKDGENRCISQFNKVLNRLTEISAVPEGLFDPLPEDATFSEISIACSHLAAYLSEGMSISSDLKSMMTNILGKKFVENIGEELREGKIGDLIRKSMPEFLSVETLDDINESFNVGTNGKLVLDTDLGAIDVRTAESEVVNIIVRRSAQLKADRNATEILKDFQVNFNEQGQELQINGKFNEEKQDWKKIADRMNIHFEITIPKTNYDVYLKTASGDISVVDTNGIVQSRTGKGKLQFENVTGAVFGHTGFGKVKLTKCKSDIRVESFGSNIEILENIGRVDAITSGGNVRCTDIVGAISAETSGGTVKLIRCKGGATVETSGGSISLDNDGPVTAKTAGGSIVANMLGQPQDDWTLESAGGDITVSLMSEILAKLDARSIGGDIKSELPVIRVGQETPKEWQLQGIINGDGPLLKFRSVGGDINLKCRNVDDDTQ
ncbi:MAG: DUF4097 family beta strand repeat-containing protein [Candidatus Poribacteria bacterium]|nr:DUF4097 family beta strand repeat-containing protein [Candidatus Poribacteria bacterium]